MALVLGKSTRSTTESGAAIQIRVPASVTRGGIDSEIPRRGSTFTSVVGGTWSDSDFAEPQLIHITHPQSTRTLKQRVVLTFRGGAHLIE